MAEENHRSHLREWKGTTVQFYAMEFERRFIWGATAAIIRNLFERLYAPGKFVMAGVPYTNLAPLTLSLSPWERERCCTLRALFRRPFSLWEKDRMRGERRRAIYSGAKSHDPAPGQRRYGGLVPVARHAGGVRLPEPRRLRGARGWRARCAMPCSAGR